jgi:tripartite ATP-independent transporter DctP family solute receptor
LYGNNVLGGDTAMLAQVRSGSIQLYSGYGGIYANVAPIAGIEAVGFAFHNQEEALRVFDGPLGAAIRKELDAKGGLVTFERAWVNGFRQITTSTHPVRDVGDLNGLKIRTPPTRIWVDMFKALGASPTPINASEMYTALQTHVVDAQENPFVILETYRLYEVQKYLSVTNHMWSNFWVVANAAAFNGLPPDLQTILRNAINTMALSNRRETELLNASLADKLVRRGMVLNTVDPAPFRARLKDFYATERDQFGATAWNLLEAGVGKLG